MITLLCICSAAILGCAENRQEVRGAGAQEKVREIPEWVGNESGHEEPVEFSAPRLSKGPDGMQISGTFEIHEEWHVLNQEEIELPGGLLVQPMMPRFIAEARPGVTTRDIAIVNQDECMVTAELPFGGTANVLKGKVKWQGEVVADEDIPPEELMAVVRIRLAVESHKGITILADRRVAGVFSHDALRKYVRTCRRVRENPGRQGRAIAALPTG